MNWLIGAAAPAVAKCQGQLGTRIAAAHGWKFRPLLARGALLR